MYNMQPYAVGHWTLGLVLFLLLIQLLAAKPNNKSIISIASGRVRLWNLRCCNDAQPCDAGGILVVTSSLLEGECRLWAPGL